MRRLRFDRHGKAKPVAENQRDADRQLSEVGIQQGIDLGETVDYSKVSVVISSSAPRAFMTASLATGFKIEDIVKLDALYPEPDNDVCREFDRLFNLLGYAPVTEYLSEEGGDCVLDWAGAVWPLVAAEISTGDDEVCVFGHAVCQQALGMVVCKDHPALVERISKVTLGEAQGYEIIFDDAGMPIDVITTED